MNRRSRWIALGVALAALTPGDVAHAEILGADLRVNGMSCPFCAFGIEKKLLAVDGVTKVEVLLDEGRLHLRFEPGNAATPSALEAAVERAGFELAGLSAQVRGTLAVDATAAWLQVHDGLRLRLVERDGDDEKPLSAASRERLKPDGHGRITASGRLLGGEGPRLVVDPPQPAAAEAP